MTRTLDAQAPPIALTAPGLRQLIPLPYGAAGRARRDPLGFLAAGAREFGDVFRYQVGPWVFLLVSHPDGVKHVLHDHNKNYPRSWVYNRTKDIIGDGLVSTEGDVWRRQRRMVQPAFNQKRVAALATPMTDVASLMLDDWAASARDGRPIDMVGELMRLTLRIVGRTLLGVDFGGEADAIGRAVTCALAFLDHRLSHFLSAPPWVPTPRNLRFRRAMRDLDAVVYGVISERRQRTKETGDLVAMMMAVRDEETGEQMTDLELRNQVMTFIGAGQETTALALAWTFYLLSQHPDVEARLRQEVDTALGGRVPTAADLPNLPFTRRVIEEALRLYPPVYAVARDAAADDVIGGYRIPRKSMVLVSQWVTHRHPGVWDDPERFDPDRFTPERSAGRPRFAWFPFLGGPHQCIGGDFAMMEATLVVAMVMQRYRLELARPAPVEVNPVPTLRPRGGLPMIAHIRH